MADHLDGREILEEVGSAIRRAVVDDQDVRGVSENLGEDRLKVRLFIVNRDGCQHSHRGA